MNGFELCIDYVNTTPILSANLCRTNEMLIQIDASNQYLNRNLMKMSSHLFSDSR